MQQFNELFVDARMRELEHFRTPQRQDAAVVVRRWDAERQAHVWERLARWASARAAAARMW